MILCQEASTQYKLTDTYRPNRRGQNNKTLLINQHKLFLVVYHASLTEINAHSPLYSINVSLVLSIKAGAASIATAIPVLMLYLISGRRSDSPRAQMDCLMRPQVLSSLRGRRRAVFGAWGVTLGKSGVRLLGSAETSPAICASDSQRMSS